MKILVTGGAGYIGSHTIIELLSTTDWEIVSIDNFVNSEAKSYDRIAAVSSRPFEHVKLDLCDSIALEAMFEAHKFDGVMHFAALKAVGESVAQPMDYYRNNILGLLNLTRAQDKYKVENLIFSSSCTVYGSTEVLPVTEDTPYGKAESPYGQTKIMGEQILKDIASAHELTTLALRYFNPVGAHKSGKIGELPNGIPNNLIPYVTQTAAGIRESLTVHGSDYETRDGTCIRDYVHVTDIARAHVAGMRHLLDGKQEHNFDFINLGTGVGVSVKEVIDTFQEVNEISLPHHYGPRRAGDIVQVYADNSKAERVLGWKPELDIKDMMRSAWAWQQHLDNQSL